MSYLLRCLPVWAVLVFVALLSGPLRVQAQQVNQPKLQHVRGVLERLDQQQGVAVVSGIAYRLNGTAKVLDSEAREQRLSAARPGTRVLLVIQSGNVDYVMLNPGPGGYLEGPSR